MRTHHLTAKDAANYHASNKSVIKLKVTTDYVKVCDISSSSLKIMQQECLFVRSVLA